MPISPCFGVAWCTRQRKSWPSSVGVGSLNPVTRQPWGFTPWNTCLMVPSLPPASIACNTTSSACFDSAHRRSWRSASLAKMLAAWSVASRSPGAPVRSAGSWSPSFTLLLGGTRHRAVGLAGTTRIVELQLAEQLLAHSTR